MGRDDCMTQSHRQAPGEVTAGAQLLAEACKERTAHHELLKKVSDKHEVEVVLGGREVSAVGVFQIEATVLEHVKAFVFNSPSLTSAGCRAFHGVGIQAKVG